MDSFTSLISAVKEIKYRPHEFIKNCIIHSVVYSDPSINNLFYNDTEQFKLDSKALSLNPNKGVYSKLSVKYHSFILFNDGSNYIKPAINKMEFDKDILTWFDNDGVYIGKGLIVDHITNLMEVKKFSDSQLLSEVKEKCMTPPFILGFDTECRSMGNQLPIYALIDFIDHLDQSGDTSNEIITFWSTLDSDIPTRKSFRDFNWIDGTSTDFHIDGIIYNEIKPYVMIAINEVDSKTKGTWFGVKTTYTYGKKLCEWINSTNGPKKYNLRSNNTIKNTSDKMNTPHPHGH